MKKTRILTEELCEKHSSVKQSDDSVSGDIKVDDEEVEDGIL